MDMMCKSLARISGMLSAMVPSAERSTADGVLWCGVSAHEIKFAQDVVDRMLEDARITDAVRKEQTRATR